MSRVVSIEQSEPGLYVVNVQRSRSASIGKMLETIGRPPVEDEPAPIMNGTQHTKDDANRSTVNGSSLKTRRKGKR